MGYRRNVFSLDSAIQKTTGMSRAPQLRYGETAVKSFDSDSLAACLLDHHQFALASSAVIAISSAWRRFRVEDVREIRIGEVEASKTGGAASGVRLLEDSGRV